MPPATAHRLAEFVSEEPKAKRGHLHSLWRMSFPEDEDEIGRGKVEEGLPGYGVWRRVPGIPRILASDKGHIMTKGADRVRKQTQDKDTYYWSVTCYKRLQRVHLMVLRAFHGPAQAHHTSGDHVGGKELSANERRSDNRACNLAWATNKQQRANQKKPRPSSTGEPCIVWKVHSGDYRSLNYMTPTGPEVQYPSMKAAGRALGFHPVHLGAIFLGKAKTLVAKDGARYTGRRVPRDDSDLEGEEWKEHSSRLWVSNHGRVQTKHATGEGWGPKRFPLKKDGETYAKVSDDTVHVLVGTLFFNGPKPLNWAVWDHKDGNKLNNHIGNLRPVTYEENSLNTERQRDIYIWKIDAPEHKILCRSQAGAARQYGLNLAHLNSVLAKRPHHLSVQGYSAAWVDDVDTDEYTTRQLYGQASRSAIVLDKRQSILEALPDEAAREKKRKYFANTDRSNERKRTDEVLDGNTTAARSERGNGQWANASEETKAQWKKVQSEVGSRPEVLEKRAASRRKTTLRKRQAELDNAPDDAARAKLRKKHAKSDCGWKAVRQKREAARTTAKEQAREVKSVLEDLIARVQSE